MHAHFVDDLQGVTGRTRGVGHITQVKHNLGAIDGYRTCHRRSFIAAEKVCADDLLEYQASRQGIGDYHSRVGTLLHGRGHRKASAITNTNTAGAVKRIAEQTLFQTGVVRERYRCTGTVEIVVIRRGFAAVAFPIGITGHTGPAHFRIVVQHLTGTGVVLNHDLIIQIQALSNRNAVQIPLQRETTGCIATDHRLSRARGARYIFKPGVQYIGNHEVVGRCGIRIAGLGHRQAVIEHSTRGDICRSSQHFFFQGKLWLDNGQRIRGRTGVGHPTGAVAGLIDHTISGIAVGAIGHAQYKFNLRGLTSLQCAEIEAQVGVIAIIQQIAGGTAIDTQCGPDKIELGRQRIGQGDFRTGNIVFRDGDAIAHFFANGG